MEKLKLKLLLVCALVILIGAAPVTVGDWNPGDPYKMHYPQEPDPDGWDVCVVCQEIADDFMCIETGAIKDIHLWVSWLSDDIGEITPDSLEISIWDDAGGVPGALKWSLQPGFTMVVRHYGTGQQGWVCPYPPAWIVPNDHKEYYQINITDIPEPLTQEADTIYWLVVRIFPTQGTIGWKTSTNVPPGPLWGMPAQFSTDGGINWRPVDTGGVVASEQHDMAFVITAGEEPRELEYGDAPEGGLAYPSGVMGNFPTCKTIAPPGHIQHTNYGAWFGPQFDMEMDGDASLCPPPGCFPTYDDDECYMDGDAGLIIPEPYTIIDGVGTVAPCPMSAGTPLGGVCTTAVWGRDIDIEVHNHMPNEAPGYVNVEIDWNQDGKWAGAASCATAMAPEHVLVNFQVPNPYDGPLSALGPPNFLIGPNPGYVWARFSITEQRVAAPWDGSGSFEHGETEDYLLEVKDIVVEDLDYGDAPDPTYPTWFASDGARHVISPPGTISVHLGSSVDPEPDGQPDAAATGDDNDGNDDEDGITFTSALIPGQTTTFDVNASTDGHLDAWVDFDGNGSWGEADNQIFASQPVPQGVSSLSFVVPAGATPGTTFARFRFSLNGGLGFTGQAPEGEVEDYIVRIKKVPKPPVPHLKWSQPPIEMDPTLMIPVYCGWDELSLEGPDGTWKMVADDYRCLGHMPVDSVHWWGSHWGWMENVPPDPQPDAWLISFWSNVPPDPTGLIPYSYPETLLWQVKVPASRVRVEWVGKDWHPYDEFPDDTCFQYYVDLEHEEYFWQDYYETKYNIYWISVVALYPVGAEIAYPWGWKTRPWSWMDDAVTFNLTGPPADGMVIDPEIVHPLIDPYFEESVDVAFELDTEPNWVKWEQPFTGIRRWPHYEDELSMAWESVDGTMRYKRVAADDWPCDQNTPVTALVWWGSYIGYRYEACSTAMATLPAKPDYFQLKIWEDVPAGVDTHYSHPGRVLWQYNAHDYDEVLVGYDKHPNRVAGPPREPVFRYSVRLPKDVWFKQKSEEGIYWLSVVAVYGPDSDPVYDWGWTNHRYVAKDDAVTGYLDDSGPAPVWVWEELFDQTGESEDLSFIVFTLDWPKCWGYLTQCHGDADGDGSVKGSDFLALKASWYKCYPDPLYNPCADFDRNGCVKGSDFLILKAYWYTSPPPDCPRGGKWPP